MSKLQELIKKLCPDGVEFRKLGEVCKIMNGKDYKHLNNGIYPVYGSGGIMNYVDNFVYDKPSVLLPRKGSIGNVFYVDSPFWTVDTIYWTRINTNFIIPKFLYYYIKTQNLEGKNTAIGAVPSLTQSVLNKIEIPLPPLEVQSEIVRILDTFTAHTAELQAELQARKEQFEYYRNKLLTFDENDERVKWMKLGNICDNYDKKRKAVTASNRVSGPYPYYGASGIVDYVNSFIFDGDFLLISEDGANLLARNTPIAFSIKGKNWVNNHAHILKFQDMCTQKYVEYYINMIDVSQYVSGGAQPKLNQENLNKIPIPIPPLSEQQRIISILDKFESLVNDLSEGLPAEIAAVQEQYEYYRNKLLTFKRKS